MADFGNFAPANYAQQVQAPFQSALQGYSAGAAIRNDQQQQQQQAAALAAQQQQQQMLNGLASNPNATAQDYAKVMTAIPAMAEPLTKAWSTKNEAQQQALTSHLTQVGAAISNGNPQAAADILVNQALAQEQSNGGQPTPESQANRANAQAILAHPQAALGTIMAKLASNPNGQAALKSLNDLDANNRANQKQPSEISLSNAQAYKATVDANVANAKAPSEVQKATADANLANTNAGIAQATAPATIEGAALKNEATAQDIKSKRIADQISGLDLQIKQANSETTRGQLTLERDKLIQEQQQKQTTKGLDAQSQIDTFQNTLQTIDTVLKHPGLDGSGSLGGVGTFAGKMAANVPGSQDRDFRAQLSTLGSQQFLTNIKQMVGMGQLSDAEGKKISDAAGNLDPDQSSKQLKTTLNVMRAAIQRAQAKVIGNGNLPTTGGAFVAKVPGIGPVSESDVNRLLMQNPGSTREQVLQYLQSKSGGK